MGLRHIKTSGQWRSAGPILENNVTKLNYFIDYPNACCVYVSNRTKNSWDPYFNRGYINHAISIDYAGNKMDPKHSAWTVGWDQETSVYSATGAALILSIGY